jgi:UDP-2,3-diacylglucosamine pyrophosphatase LpxH
MGLSRVWRRIRGSSERPHNLLAISDLHLGCDLKPGHREARRGFDAQLAEFLDFHATHRKNGKPWRLILNGDIVDFVAITVTPPPDEAPFEVRPEEREFGLAAEEEKCAWKLRKTAERHAEVFDALARFLHRGNFLHIVRGNHDAEFHWPAVQEEFRKQLGARLGLRGAALKRLSERIEFHPWFYLEPGFFYAEHGNAHDRYSVQSGFFDPAGVRQELELPLSSLVLRYFANRYAESAVLEDCDTWGPRQYIDWVLKAGNPLRIAADYFVMVARVTYPILVQWLRFWRKFARAADRAIARVEGVPLPQPRFSGTPAQARQLLGIAPRPAEESLFEAMQLFYLDRMLLALLCLAGSWAAVATAHGVIAKVGAAAAMGIVFAALNALLGRTRKTDAHPMLQMAARRIAKLFGVQYVVMGHSHRVVDESLGGSARYLNLGSWATARKGFPHVAVEEGVAELRYWTGAPNAARPVEKVRQTAPAQPAPAEVLASA